MLRASETMTTTAANQTKTHPSVYRPQYSAVRGWKWPADERHHQEVGFVGTSQNEIASHLAATPAHFIFHYDSSDDMTHSHTVNNMCQVYS